MKKHFGKWISVLLALAFTLSFAVSSFAYETTSQFNNVTDTFTFVMRDSHPLGGTGPIVIVQGTLHENGTDTPIYFVSIHGTEFTTIGESCDIDSDNKVMAKEADKYSAAIKKGIQKYVPKGSNLVISGHSLGGMECQIIAADEDIKRDYNILYTVPIATPPLDFGEVEGPMNILVDEGDMINLMTDKDSADYAKIKDKIHYEKSDYTLFNAHTHSYEDPAVWGEYDAVGQKGGNATITLDLSTMKNVPATKYDSQKGVRLYASMENDGNNWLGVSVLL